MVGSRTTYNFGVSIKRAVIPRHGPLARYTRLSAHQLQNLKPLFPLAQPLGDFHGHFLLVHV